MKATLKSSLIVKEGDDLIYRWTYGLSQFAQKTSEEVLTFNEDIGVLSTKENKGYLAIAVPESEVENFNPTEFEFREFIPSPDGFTGMRIKRIED